MLDLFEKQWNKLTSTTKNLHNRGITSLKKKVISVCWEWLVFLRPAISPHCNKYYKYIVMTILDLLAEKAVRWLVFSIQITKQKVTLVCFSFLSIPLRKIPSESNSCLLVSPSCHTDDYQDHTWAETKMVLKLLDLLNII